MNKKGFTLIETIMVIAILALLMLILVPNVISLINKNNIKSCQNLEASIKNAAKVYVANNKYQLGFNCPDNNSTSKINVKLQSLVNSGNLKVEGELTNPVTEGTIDLNSVVEVTYNCKNKDFTYVFSLDCE
ncbi:MAG: prepilin-type N-terminal cleavage/methylation domain-containing protein [Bacilli bacterium]|nr:prepilin-type N-terminal cleavage/methylation domain-containing protein [Bacilli bacterium]